MILSIFFLFGIFVLSTSGATLRRLGKFQFNELARSFTPFFFPYFLHPLFSRKQDWENISLSISLTKPIVYVGFALSSLFYCLTRIPPLSSSNDLNFFWIGGILLAIALSVDFLAHLFAYRWTSISFKSTAPLSSLYLSLSFPLIAILLKSIRAFVKKIHFEEELLKDKSKIREMIRESDLQPHLDATDQTLIASFIYFKERVGKEIMVPRVDIYALDAETSIQEAASLFAKEGYSRIPIYRESLDQIVGVVLYKDLLRYYADPKADLKAPLETIAKPVLYAPENKKITQLLQEFRNKQIHMAIIVDEYGGTEGIVTIEDILEELVGEIEDEYDIGEEHEFWELPGGGWILNAKMTIHDIEERIGLKIPPHPEYETIGGYIYHCAGTIPPKGWRLSHDEFELEVLSSNERSIKKVKIQPRPASQAFSV